ncbi:FtsK/SpoIIIE domain-containing protein [Haliangium sp.]|uniref:FtsK/SpoIIIE domain-containing protein n=1 Tax=Haliangium sp. TaxID=2663208 RepID=UPI003D0F3C1A
MGAASVSRKHDQTLERFGGLAAEAVLARIGVAGRSHSRYVIDFLPDGERRALFDALIQRADGDASVLTHTMQAVRAERVDVLPVLVDDSGNEDGNVVSDGWACKLRDHYSAGADAGRYRALLTLTPESNETQKSASEGGVDRALLALPVLAEALWRQHGLDRGDERVRALDIYLEYADERTPRSAHLDRMAAFLKATARRKTSTQGRALGRLGCMFSDSSSDWAERLDKNATLRVAVDEAFANPLEDLRTQLGTLLDKGRAGLDEESVEVVYRAGVDGLSEVDFASLRVQPVERSKRNAFVRESIELTDALHHHLITDIDEPVLVVAAAGPFTLELGLARALAGKSHVHLVGWDSERGRRRARKGAVHVHRSRTALRVRCESSEAFAVWKLIISSGARSYVKHQDCIWLAVYQSEEPWVAYELDGELSLEMQAWEQAGGEACFERLTRDGAATTLRRPRPDGDSEVSEVAGVNEVEDDTQLSGDELLSQEELGEGAGRLVARVHWTGLEGEGEGEAVKALPWLEAAFHRKQSQERRQRLWKSLCSQPRHLATSKISRRANVWSVSLAGGEVRLKIERWNHHGEEDAVGQLLAQPEVCALSRRRDGAGWAVTSHSFDDAFADAAKEFLAVRTELFTTLREQARGKATAHGAEEAPPVALGLVDLGPVRELIGAYLDAWIEACDAVTPASTTFTSVHRLLLDTDTLIEYDREGDAIARVTVLPTHPWLLWALLNYQDTIAAAIDAGADGLALPLQASEVEQLVRPAPFDDWYAGADGSQHLCRVDGPPFCWSFIPRAAFRRHGGRDYLARVVQHKLKRYLRMHRHLSHDARTLRIGFVNPGDGAHLLDGIKRWVRSALQDDDGNVRWIPDIEVLLFSSHGVGEGLGSAFDAFFKDSSLVAQEQATHVLLDKLRYLKLDRRGPENVHTSVHVCFVNALIRDDDLRLLDRRIDDGWDGCFGDGLLATPLRASRLDGTSRRTERGLWIADEGRSPGRRGLARTAALLRGRKRSSIDLSFALFWGGNVPPLADMRGTYEHSDWVVHLDRSLGLDVFRDFERELHAQSMTAPAPDRAEATPMVVEYSDQEEPDTPGYDTVTVTGHTLPYVDQLAKALDLVSLPLPESDAAEHRCAHGLLRDINAVSGSWALDLIEGNMSQKQASARLRGHVGVTLGYRWLRRVETLPLQQRYGGRVLPLFLDLEEVMRATPSGGRAQQSNVQAAPRGGDDHDHTDEHEPTCDDLLVLYLAPLRDRKLRMVGRVVEVKFALEPTLSVDQAVAQVKDTRARLRDFLGGEDRREAVFRNKQLSLMVKTRIEQLRALAQVHDPDTVAAIEQLDVHRLSAAIASGDYEVDYTIAVDGRDYLGDVFLMRTVDDGDDLPGQARVTEKGGVRVIELSKASLKWLAFEGVDVRTLHEAPTNTLPGLGRHEGGFGAELMDAAASASDLPATPTPAPTREAAAEPEVHVDAAASSTPDPDVATGDEARVVKPDGAEVVGSVADVTAPVQSGEVMDIDAACHVPVKVPEIDPGEVATVVERLERALRGHKIKLEASPSSAEARIGPRLVRVHVRLEPGESIGSVRRISEDLARNVGTLSPDVHVCNVPELHAVGIDLPIASLGYAVGYAELMAHPSFAAAGRAYQLGVCAGIDVTGNPVWVDLAAMPHALVAGTTGSGKTVFLRQLLLTLLLQHSPRHLQIRLSSTKAMDFRPFANAPHAAGTSVASNAQEALALVRTLIEEMDRRYARLDDAECDNLPEYNEECEHEEQQLPYLVAVLDEFAETVLSFEDKAERAEFERAVARLAQKSRAAGIHMVLCMQRPDSTVLQGPIKSNVLHRFALKLPQSHDSRVILDENGAETLLGQGDLLYRDANSRLFRLQVPNLDKRVLKARLRALRG